MYIIIIYKEYIYTLLIKPKEKKKFVRKQTVQIDQVFTKNIFILKCIYIFDYFKFLITNRCSKSKVKSLQIFKDKIARNFFPSPADIKMSQIRYANPINPANRSTMYTSIVYARGN